MLPVLDLVWDGWLALEEVLQAIRHDLADGFLQEARRLIRRAWRLSVRGRVLARRVAAGLALGHRVLSIVLFGISALRIPGIGRLGHAVVAAIVWRRHRQAR